VGGNVDVVEGLGGKENEFVRSDADYVAVFFQRSLDGPRVASREPVDCKSLVSFILFNIPRVYFWMGCGDSPIIGIPSIRNRSQLGTRKLRKRMEIQVVNTSRCGINRDLFPRATSTLVHISISLGQLKHLGKGTTHCSQSNTSNHLYRPTIRIDLLESPHHVPSFLPSSNFLDNDT
jgi:hypothetical protein